MSKSERFIIDTNTIISSLLIRNSTAFQAMEKAKNAGAFIFSEETFLEFEIVLFRKKFDKYFTKEERLQIINKLYTEGTFVQGKSNIKACRDAKDDKFLNLAIDGKVSFIITGDKDLLELNPFRKVKILSASDFLKIR